MAERSQRHSGGFIICGAAFMPPSAPQPPSPPAPPLSPPSSPSFWTVTSGAQYCHITGAQGSCVTDGAGSYGNRSPAQSVLTPR